MTIWETRTTVTIRMTIILTMNATPLGSQEWKTPYWRLQELNCNTTDFDKQEQESEPTETNNTKPVGVGLTESKDENLQRSSFGHELRSTQGDIVVCQHLQHDKPEGEQNHVLGIIEEHILTQYSLSAGLKKLPELEKRLQSQN